MSTERLGIFPHRQNEDGTFDSICPECFSTVVRGLHTERQLVEFEDQHVCHSDSSAEQRVSFENIVLVTRRVLKVLKDKRVSPLGFRPT
jgi:hypothetical protein